MSVPDWLIKYYERGFRLVFYPSGQKGPSGADAVKWTERSDSADDYEKWIERHKAEPNVGVFLGHEISPGHFLADIDFDWPEGLQLSRRLLPKTEFGFGRTSRQISHAFYTTPGPLQSKSFDNIDGKPLVELRGTTTKGLVGMQTMMPPSIHPSGESVVIRSDGAIGHSDHLERDVTVYAIAALIYFHLGHRGLLHDVRLAVAGFLLTEGLEEEEVSRVCEAIAEISGNNVADAALAVKSTASRIRAHEHVLGRGALIKIIGEDGRKICSRIREWLGGEDFILNPKGVIIPDNQDNILRAIEKLNITLSFDTFVDKPFIHYNGYEGVLKDEIYDQTWLDIQRNFHFRPSIDYYHIVSRNIAFQHKFHPVKDYLDSLKWDGVPRVDDWLIMYGGAAESPYTRAVGSLVLIAACRRVRQPGCKFDELMVLESEQGMMKSSALRALCSNPDWFSDDLPLNVDAKQIIERTAGKWIIEASELKGMSSNREVESLKAMLSRQVDGPVRLAYARFPVEQSRQFIVIGTTNSHSYLVDETGSRRFWPVRVIRFNIEAMIADRDQLWAEASQREAAGESIRLNESLYGLAGLQQERRRVEDPWEVVLRRKFHDPNSRFRITQRDIYGEIGISVDKYDKRNWTRLTNIMQGLGFRKITLRDKDTGDPEKGWGRDPKGASNESDEKGED